MKIKKYCIPLFIVSQFFLAQEMQQKYSEYFLMGQSLLSRGEFEKAEDNFEKSINEFQDAESYYELAKLNLRKNTPVFRTKALRLFKRAVWKSPENIEYRTAYAKLLEEMAKFNAVLEYEKIIKLDTTATDAWMKLGDIKREEFEEYYNSVREMSEDVTASYDKYALDDFDDAEYYYKKALETDPQNTDVVFKLAKLYERKDSLEGSIHYLRNLLKIDPSSKDGHLFLGYCLHITENYIEAHKEFTKAMALMNQEEKNDFTVASVLEMITPIFDGLENVTDRNYISNVIKAYWKISDPLYLQNINERLLEHYARVAYSNVQFTVEKMKIPGWKTDRGKTVLRYGIPKQWLRYRPSIGEEGVSMKTEVWEYDDMVFGFTDQFMSGNYAYSAPMGEVSRYSSQFDGDSHTYAQHLVNVRPQIYNPPFSGPRFEFDYNITQFRNPDRMGLTDFYLSYFYAIDDSQVSEEKNYTDHRWEIILFNKYFEEVFEDGSKDSDTGQMKTTRNNSFLSNVLSFEILPDSGMLSFKLFRDFDRGSSALLKNTVVKKYEKNKLEVSDLIFADYIGNEKSDYGIRRNELSIHPANHKNIQHGSETFIYYEIYSLQKGSDSLTDFTVELEIKVKEKEGFMGGLSAAINSTLQIIGLSENESITLTGNYKTNENNPQMYMQLNLSELPESDYILTIKVKDNLNNSVGKSMCEFTIR